MYPNEYALKKLYDLNNDALEKKFHEQNSRRFYKNKQKAPLIKRIITFIFKAR
ncbi:hypothetical protein [Bacillus sp. SA1-12]|uniref:hypothetical protein n=1 Tax=Bacillus sp. SA1-12 TaxID=1455638 RepID=UPI000B01DD35|nr:hypothetical protein [Bacillus sp. SA1-12]